MWMCIPGKLNCVILCLQILDYAFDRMGVDGAEVIKHFYNCLFDLFKSLHEKGD